jgi:hypothetical protein
MNAYFDDEQNANLHILSDHSLNIFPLTFNHIDIKRQLADAGFNIVHSNTYEEPGIYVVSVREYSPHWSGNNHNRHILYELPLYVIRAARLKKIVIVIDNQSEGFPMQYQGCDGFKEMHDAMRNLKLPPMSVIFLNADLKFKDSYDHWLISNFENRMIGNSYALTSIFYFQNKPEDCLLKVAILNKNSLDFNSLNRSARQHRIEHIVELFDRRLIKKGLVSGYYTNNPNSRNFPNSVYKEDSIEQFKNKIINYLSTPLQIDGDWSDRSGPSPDTDPRTIFNHEIFKNSLLSVVTETAMDFPGIFITEKTLKPIVAGHPFMVLGQYKFLDSLRDMGYKVDFPGIDQSYDDIINPIERFNQFHNSLEKWCKYSRKDKTQFCKSSLELVKHNMKLFNSTRFELDYCVSLKKEAERCLSYRVEL